jgi:PAS domain S-box-containing protein
MISNRPLRNIIIGKNRYLNSRKEYKTAMLRGYLCLITLLGPLAFLASDAIMGQLNTVIGAVYVGFAFISIMCFWLNRIGYYKASTIIWIVSSNCFIYIFASSNSYTYIFFMPIALASMAICGYVKLKWGILFVSLTFAVFLLAFSGYFHLLPLETMEHTKRNSLLNFSAVFTCSLLLLYFLLSLNHYSEKSLHQSQEKLNDAANELNKSKQRFELAIAGSNAGIWEWNIKENTNYKSLRWKSMLGYGHSELTDMNSEGFQQMIYHEDRPKVEEALKIHLERKKSYHVEFRATKKDGSLIWVADSGVAIFDEKGNPSLMAGSIIDITERKEIEQKIVHQNELLLKANAELDRFVYSASHDLRSPLSSILGLINIAQKTTHAEEVAVCLRLMNEQIQTLENFITEIQDYSRNSRKEVTLEPVDLASLSTEIIKSMIYSEKADTLHFHNLIPSTLIKTDRARLKVVLSNLIGNAIKYADLTKDNPNVILKSSIANNYLHIHVIDNGIGISDEHHSKIFDMFYRASENSKGSGLGLYIVKETLLKLRGEISLQSSLGEGTAFEVKLPA